ncbi:hypothetical protein PPERSA_09171 [Pseudocohnilembus persalinus]|uniref:Amino acid transporter transmembrane domain-containing protein n=1 Tax=Pseudocohnilembus persalinus TaxID=266149 RepID=A0A0V0QX80_PSEPJ|nr:hypothetical protein PPERSA_09171 [Pseudocohnilembus persalinus]|eukprot:KRX06769.1 hypothetical protein PPERSA_09171 [Pseudocohnilembus persalinus]
MEFNDQNKEQDQVSVYMTKKYELSDLVSSYFLLIKGYFSIGILTFPMIFYQAGYLLAAGVIIMIGILTVYSVNLLIQIQEDINKKQSVEEDNAPILHYSDIAQAIYGNKGVFIIKTFTVVFQIGSCLSYLVFFKQPDYMVKRKNSFGVDVYSYNLTLNDDKIQFLRRYFVRILIIFGIFLLSTIQGKFLNILSIVGSIGGIFNQFVFPSMMYERYFSKKIKPWKSLVNKFTQICGVMGGLLGIYIGLGKV